MAGLEVGPCRACQVKDEIDLVAAGRLPTLVAEILQSVEMEERAARL